MLMLIALVHAVALQAPPQVPPLPTPDPVVQDDMNSPALRIEYDEFKKLYDKHGVVVIDTRDAASFEAGHIPGARVIPASAVADHLDELKRLKKPIVTYCS